MFARDVMQSPVMSVAPRATIFDAVERMLKAHVSGLPVVESNGRLVGMITEGDLLRRGEIATERVRPRWLEFLRGPGRAAEDYVHTHGRFVEEVMTPDAIWIEEQTPLETVVELMERHKIKRVPVLRENRLVGIITRADLLRALLAAARRADRPAPSDAEIEAAIRSEFAARNWAPESSLRVDVHEGIVDIAGTIFDERERLALMVAAENVPGVVKVRDHLVSIEPVSGLVLNTPDEPTH